MVAARQQTETTMATIGTFTQRTTVHRIGQDSRSTSGEFVATRGERQGADYRIFAGSTDYAERGLCGVVSSECRFSAVSGSPRST